MKTTKIVLITAITASAVTFLTTCYLIRKNKLKCLKKKEKDYFEEIYLFDNSNKQITEEDCIKQGKTFNGVFCI